MIRKIGLVIGIFGLGVVLGPILLALVAGVFASSDDNSRWRQTYNLLQAYDEYRPQLSMHGGDWEPDIADCGYRRDMVYDARDNLVAMEHRGTGPAPYRDVSWTPYSGHFALHGWRTRQFESRVETLRTDFLRNRFGRFSAIFLARCVRHSVAATLCADRVGKALDEAGLLSPNSGPTSRSGFLDGNRESQVICTYLDGLAARRGHPLAERSNRR